MMVFWVKNDFVSDGQYDATMCVSHPERGVSKLMTMLYMTLCGAPSVVVLVKLGCKRLHSLLSRIRNPNMV